MLIKSGYPSNENPVMLQKMRQLNPASSGSGNRPIHRLCNGQSLLCKSLGLKVKTWDCQGLESHRFRLLISGPLVEPPVEIIQTTRLGIPKSRDQDHPYRFIHKDYVKWCSKNPLTLRKPPNVLKTISLGKICCFIDDVTKSLTSYVAFRRILKNSMKNKATSKTALQTCSQKEEQQLKKEIIKFLS